MWTLECVPFGTGLKSKVLSEHFAVVLLIINSGNSICVSRATEGLTKFVRYTEVLLY